MRFTKVAFTLIALFFAISGIGFSQVIDTIANWDGTNVNWTASGVSTQVVQNPDQLGINPSPNCLEAITSSGQYDLIFTDFSSPVNFEEFPKYRIKVLAPFSGGSILFKFENSTNTSWHEIEKTPIPGQWEDLEFDFTGVTATDYVRMVIFFDFLGTSPGNQWYLDDVLRISAGSAGLTSNLPIVIIDTYGVPIPDEPKITGEMYIIDNGPGNLNNQYDPPNGYDGFIGIEIRGQSSQMFPKKSFGFETRDEEGENLNVSLLGMPEENDWILYAPYSDKSMLRNFISFYMGSKLDTYCTRMAYCEVIENNDYKGVYILMEKIKKDDNRVNIATLKPEDISGDELTGGYIIKVDKIDPDFQYGVHGWKSIPSPPYPNAINITFQFYYPKAEDIVFQQKNYIQTFILTAENALTGSSFSDPDVGYNKYFNPGSFIDHMILREVSKEVDSYRYSTFFYKEKDSDGGKLFAGPPWDFNLGYSNVDYWPPGNNYAGWVYPMGTMFWWKRLMENSYFRNLFKTRWNQLREDDLSNDQLEFAIDSIVEYIYDAQVRNYERWPILGTYVWPNYNWQGNDYDDEVEFFETWLFNRVTWIDNNIPGQLLFPTAELTGSLAHLKITLSDDYFSREILKNKYFTLNNAPIGLTIDTVVFENASQASVYLQGNINDPVEISITIDKKVINSFSDLTSNVIEINVGFESDSYSPVEFFTSGQTIYIQSVRPGLLGDRLELYNISGQLVNSVRIFPLEINYISFNVPSGVYFCRFNYSGHFHLIKVALVK